VRKVELGVAAPAERGAKVSISARYREWFGQTSFIQGWDVAVELAWPGDNPVIWKWMRNSSGIQVAIVAHLTWIDSTSCHAPLVPLRGLRFQEFNQIVVAPVLSTSPRTHVPNTGGTQVSRRYFCQPGTYSGDDWVAAAALLLQPELRGFVVSYRQEQVTNPRQSKYLTKARQALAFYEQCGVSSHVEQVFLSSVKQYADVDHLEPCGEWIKAEPQRRGDPQDVKLVNITTSVLMSAIELRGISTVCASLRERFTATLDEQGRIRAARRAAPLYDLVAKQRVVLVNMRLATYNVENIITEAIYWQIVRLAASFGCVVVRVGAYQDDDGYRKYGQWVRQLDNTALDIYGVNEKGFVPADLRETAWFWALVYELQTKNRNLVGVIGGRSGSLDIAAFMGVRTLSFDIVDPRDWEYIRMFMTYPLMSIAGRTGAAHRPKRSTNLAKDAELRNGVIDPQALCHWLAGGNVVPIHALSPLLFLPQYRYLINARDHGPRDAYRRYLAYMEQHVDWSYVDDLEPEIVRNEIEMDDDEDSRHNDAPVIHLTPVLDLQEIERRDRIARLKSDLEGLSSGGEDYLTRNQILRELRDLGGY